MKKPVVELREPVRWFAEQMERKLRENDHKEHWGELQWQHLVGRISEETEELREACETQQGTLAVVREAADVANFAMMLADNARFRDGSVGTTEPAWLGPERYSQATKDAHGAVIDAGMGGDETELLRALRHLAMMVHCDRTGELRDAHSGFTPGKPK